MEPEEPVQKPEYTTADLPALLKEYEALDAKIGAAQDAAFQARVRQMEARMEQETVIEKIKSVTGHPDGAFMLNGVLYAFGPNGYLHKTTGIPIIEEPAE